MPQEMPRYVRGHIIAPLRTDAHLCAPIRPGTRRCPRMYVYVCGCVWVCVCSWVCPALSAAFRIAGRICQSDRKSTK